MPFRDRRDAGRQLAGALSGLRAEHPVVLGLPRGGVPVAYEVACALAAPLDVVVVRKLGVPGSPEVAMGAVGEDGAVVRDVRVLGMAHVAVATFTVVEEQERAELTRRVHLLRAVRPRVPLGGRTAVLVDDGIATGSTARVACAVVLAQGAVRVVLAVPVCAAEATRALAGEVDELVSVVTPERLGAVGRWYADFRATGDDEVVELLRRRAVDQPL